MLNTRTRPDIGLSPFQCVFGFQPPLFPWDTSSTDVPAVDDWFCQGHRVWEQTRRLLERHSLRDKAQADRHRRPAPPFRPGQRVWLSTKNLRLPGCRKLAPRYIGPFRILRQVSAVSYRLQLPRIYRISPTFHVSLLKPVRYSVVHPSAAGAAPPPPIPLDDGDAYSVRALLDSRRRRGRLQYLVDWEGYGPEERAWVPASDVLDPDMVLRFHRDHPSRPCPRPRGRPPSHASAAQSRPLGGGSVTPLLVQPPARHRGTSRT